MAPLVRQAGKVPGTDPRFHQAKFYMTPVTYRGREILGFVGSCRENGCKYTGMWTTKEARDIGYFQNHRKEMVKEARRSYFAKLCGYNQAGVDQRMLYYADRNSHTYDEWVLIVEGLYRGKLGEPFTIEPKNNKLQVDYHLGQFAKEAVKRIYEENHR